MTEYSIGSARLYLPLPVNSTNKFLKKHNLKCFFKYEMRYAECDTKDYVGPCLG